MKIWIKKSVCIFALAFLFFSCKGTGNTKNNAGVKDNSSADSDLTLKSLSVYQQSPDNLKNPVFIFGKDKTKIETRNVKATFDYTGETNKEIDVIVENGNALKVGDNSLTLKVNAVKGKHKGWALPIKVTIVEGGQSEEVPTLTLENLNIYGVPATDIETAPKVKLAKDKTTITAQNIDAYFKYGRERNKKIEVVVTGGENLHVGKNTINLSVVAKDKEYKAWGPQAVEVELLAGNASTLTLTSLKIHGVSPASLDAPEVEVDANIESVTPGDVEAKFSYGSHNDKRIQVIVQKGDDIEAGENEIKLVVDGVDGEYTPWEKKVVVVRKGTPQDLTLSSMSVHKVSCTGIPASPTCEVPKDKTSVTPADVVAQFNYGDKVNKALDVIVVSGGTLQMGENTVVLKVLAKKYRYNEWNGSVSVIVKDTEVELKLTKLFIHGEEASDNNTKVSFDHKYKTVASGDVKATFQLKAGQTRVIPVEVRDCPATLPEGVPTNIKLFVPASKDEYKEKEVVVEVTRKVLPAKVASNITGFKFEGKDTPLSQVVETKVFESSNQKPSVVLETDRMFEKCESEDFVVKYENNRKQLATLTLKEALQANVEKAVSIKVATKTPDAEQEDLEKELKFKIKLLGGTLAIEKIESEGVSITDQNKTLIVNKATVHINAYIKNKGATGVQATLEEDGTTPQVKYEGSLQGVLFTFKNVALQENVDKSFTLKVSGANIQEQTFKFKATYKQKENKVVIEKVTLVGNEIADNAEVEVKSASGSEVKVYLAEEYEEMNVTVDGKATTQPYAPGNKKVFSATLDGLVENTQKDIAIVAKAKNKTQATFNFKVTYKKSTEVKLISRVLAQSKDDEDNGYVPSSMAWAADHFEGSVGGTELVKIVIEIADLQGKTLANLKGEFSKGADKIEGAFKEDGGKWICELYVPSSIKTLIDGEYTDFTVKVLENDSAIETRTVKIKGM